MKLSRASKALVSPLRTSFKAEGFFCFFCQKCVLRQQSDVLINPTRLWHLKCGILFSQLLPPIKFLFKESSNTFICLIDEESDGRSLVVTRTRGQTRFAEERKKAAPSQWRKDRHRASGVKFFLLSSSLCIYKYFTPPFHTGPLLKAESVGICESARVSRLSCDLCRAGQEGEYSGRFPTMRQEWPNPTPPQKCRFCLITGADTCLRLSARVAPGLRQNLMLCSAALFTRLLEESLGSCTFA